VPALIAGVLLKDTIETDWRDPAIICWTTVIFGLLLYAADRVAASRPFGAMNLRHAMIVGVAQAIALLPGVSRSGITMTAGRALGYGREEAARFSFLLSLPVTAAAGLAKAYDLLQSGDAALQADAALAALVSFATALVVIWGLLAWLRRFSFTPFVLYRLALGAALMAWLYL
jgi:undecaprenyl-diphosphatase